jgi:gliding motility-associated-like protein
MKFLKVSIVAFLALLSGTLGAQTALINNGMIITIGQGTYVSTQDFVNTQTDGTNGEVVLNGNLNVAGNFTNNSTGNVFTNIETIPDGNIVLNGANQSISGTTPVYFENLDIQNETKTLNLANCEVKGTLILNGVLDLNKSKLIIDNSANTALVYKSGFVISETHPSDGLGEIEWKIGETTGTYAVPFGSGNSSADDLKLVLAVNTAAYPETGSVIFATYPTDGSNDPLPLSVTSLDTFKAETLSDRYWKIEPNYITKPNVSITFDYGVTDVDLSDNPKMIEANLKAIRYNDQSGTWLDMKMSGMCDLTNKSVTIDKVSGDNFYSFWTLSEYVLRIPNAFTPNNDGKNDIFLKDYEVKIVNRWGELLYEGKDGWDGTSNEKLVSPGTYYYIATIPDYDNNMKTINGVITLIIPE